MPLTPSLTPQVKLGLRIPPEGNTSCVKASLLPICFGIWVMLRQEALYQLTHGVKYKVLHLANDEILNFEPLKIICQFAKQGGVFIGELTQQLAGLNYREEQLAEFKRMVDFISSQPTPHSIVKSTESWQALYQQRGLNFDLQVKRNKGAYYAHRKIAVQEIYFVYNKSGKRQLFHASFEVTGKVPELWDAKTGKTKKLAAYTEANGLTQVAFRLEPNESAFFVFSTNANIKAQLNQKIVRARDIEVLYDEQFNVQLIAKDKLALDVKVNGQTKKIINYKLPSKQELTGSWQVSFEINYGLDKSVTFDSLSNSKDATAP